MRQVRGVKCLNGREECGDVGVCGRARCEDRWSGRGGEKVGVCLLWMSWLLVVYISLLPTQGVVPATRSLWAHLSQPPSLMVVEGGNQSACVRTCVRVYSRVSLVRILELEACVEGVVSDSSEGPLSTLSGRSGVVRSGCVVAGWRWMAGG